MEALAWFCIAFGQYSVLVCSNGTVPGCSLTIALTIFKYSPSNFNPAKFCYSIHCFKLNNSYRHNLLNDKSIVDSNLLYINIKTVYVQLFKLSN